MSSTELWGVSEAEKQAIKERQAIRDALRRDFQRKINNPGHRGFLVDPAVERWNYTRHRPSDFFKASPKTVQWGIFVGILPPLLLVYTSMMMRKRRFARYDSGEEKEPRVLFFC